MTRPYSENSTVTLTATISYNGSSDTTTYEILVPRGYKDLSDGGIAAGYLYTSIASTTNAVFTTLDVILVAFGTASATGTISNASSMGSLITSYVTTKAHTQGDYVLLSINNKDALSTIAASSSLRTTFANNIVSFINTYNIDGVDIDWEFPTTDEKANYTLLMKEINEKVKANNSEHLVTSATGIDTYTRYDFENSSQYLDYICVMTYDMHTSSYASLHNALYYKSGKCYKAVSNTATYYITNSGISPSKLILGIPFYGRSYTGTTGLGQSYDSTTTISYSSIVSNYLNSANFGTTITRTLDSDCQVPYIYDSTNQVLISYEDAESIAIKTEYIKDNGWAGIFFWQNGQDSNGSLLAAVANNKANLK